MRNNNFDSMRLAAAVAVVVSHSFPLSYGVGYPEPLDGVTNAQMSLGGVAVIVFFILSGYLITGSFRRQTPGHFLAARALRILPALATVLVILAFLLGPAVTSLPLREYFGSAAPYKYVARNLSLTGYVGGLPGVFDANPFPHAVDGSLWTLRYEAECYLLVFVLGITGLLNRHALGALFVVMLLCSWLYFGGNRALFYSYFLAGAVFHAWHPPLRWWLALFCAALLALSFRTGFRLAAATAGAYFILYIGLASEIRLPKVTRWGDLSYGTYVWAWPAQQIATIFLGAWAAWYFNLLIALPATMGVAFMSWRFVERPALALRSRG